MMPPALSELQRVAAKLRELIDGSGRSMRDVARSSGIAQANLSRICAGQTDPTVSTVARILTELGADWSDLV